MGRCSKFAQMLFMRLFLHADALETRSLELAMLPPSRRGRHPSPYVDDGDGQAKKRQRRDIVLPDWESADAIVRPAPRGPSVRAKRAH
jgi:hypothetical protein